MGKKTKTGKSRKDKFYQLAKETGYRSRAAFKLLQLNRKYEFLQGSRVVIDLCAAPGGWLQVAAQNCPMSSLIIGVDLVSIPPIARVQTYQEDITTSKCRQTLRRELQTWKADCVLNDGAPNLGKNWFQDAFSQAQLTVHALRLAVDFLRPGGWFVTKLFRSKDYQHVLNAFESCFKQVHVTKPQASRNESAEIFVVCQSYQGSYDRAALDPAHIFAEESAPPSDAARHSLALKKLLAPEKIKKPNRSGYADDRTMLFTLLPASDFINADHDHLELLAAATRIELDADWIREHALTTSEVQACCADIPVCGKREVRLLLQWRTKLRKEMLETSHRPPHRKAEAKASAEPNASVTLDDGEAELKAEETALADAEREVDELAAQEARSERRLQKQRMRERKRRREADQYGATGDVDGSINTECDTEVFSLLALRRRVERKRQNVDVSDDEAEQDDVEDDDEDHNVDKEPDVDDEAPEAVEDLIVEDPANRRLTDAEAWFGQRKIFQEMGVGVNDDDEAGMLPDDVDAPAVSDHLAVFKPTDSDLSDIEMEGDDGVKSETGVDEADADDYDSWKGSIVDRPERVENPKRLRKRLRMEKREARRKRKEAEQKEAGVIPTGAVSRLTELDQEEDEEAKTSEATGDQMSRFDDDTSSEEEEDKEATPAPPPNEKLAWSDDEEDVAKRYMFNDDNLPSWFVEDERKYSRPPLPVTKEEIDFYKARLKAIDARPLKKVAEATARKRRRAQRKLEKVRNRADNVADSEELGESEKWHKIKDMYKKAGLLGRAKKEPVTYVVAKRGAGKKVSRPTGVKGKFKVVDSRMKKDVRAQKRADKRGKKGRGRGGGTKGRGAKNAAKAGQKKGRGKR